MGRVYSQFLGGCTSSFQNLGFGSSGPDEEVAVVIVASSLASG